MLVNQRLFLQSRGKKGMQQIMKLLKTKKLNTHKRKVINLEKAVPDAATLIHNNQ